MLFIDDLLMLPAKGFMGIIQKIHEMVERELSDETYVRKSLWISICDLNQVK